MMIQIWSDLHLDVMDQICQQRGRSPETFTVHPDTDILILAGDISESTEGLIWAEQFDIPVLYVPGNHEFYRSHIDEFELELRRTAAASKNVTLLHNDSVIIDGVRFLGSTLWTDYALEGRREQAMLDAERYLIDHRLISAGHGAQRRLFSAQDALNIYSRCVEWLTRKLAEHHDGPTVIITHHAPSIRSVHDIYLISKSPVNACFSSNLEHLMRDHDIELWIHGHTHHAFDYVLHGTRVVCNPYGYFGTHELDDFNMNCLVEL